MKDIFDALLTVVVSLGGLLAFLSLLYLLTTRLPKSWRERTQMWVFLGPALFVMFIGLAVPAIRTIIASLYDDRTGKKFVGLDHYQEIFSGKDTRLTVVNSFTWVIVGTATVLLVGLTVARFADGIRGERTVKSLIFIPAAISLAGAGIIWKFVYAGPPFKVGLLNQVTKAIPGMPASMGGDGDYPWLVQRSLGAFTPPSWAPGFNTFLLIVIFVWSGSGFATVVFSAAIKGVPESLIEAAKVDGANSKQAFYKVTLPYIRATIVAVATTTIIAGLKAFDIVLSTTGGNFGTSTIANDFYSTYFVQDREAFGSALAVLLFVLVIPVVVINRRAAARAEEMLAA
jgi:alpha-glucoside transport system permease protein